MPYTIEKSKDSIRVVSESQYFTEEDCKSLMKDHSIYYDCGVIAAYVEKRNHIAPLVHLLVEDDGCISWTRGKNTCFDIGWLDNVIEMLELVRDTN